MKILSRRGGFSLVELLTVIAIIAILAAIIFPVMSSVKNRARVNNCMTNLHQIAMAVDHFKTDNRHFPETLGGVVLNTDNESWLASGGTIKPFEDSPSDEALFSEYVKSISMFHCPASWITNTQEAASYSKDPSSSNADIATYAYNSYDCYVERGTPTGSAYGPANVEVRYTTSWVPRAQDTTDAAISWIMNDSTLQPYPLGTAETETTAQRDYERQLRWRTPPADTVVTWCSYHENRDGATSPQQYKGKAIVVFLDGHTDIVPADEMAQCKWRIRPQKG